MKVCARCKVEKSLSEFRYSRGKIQSYCKPCKVEWDKEYYQKNKARRDSVRETNKRILARNRQYLVSFLEENPCIDCGESDIRVLEFDHLRDKVVGVAVMASKLVSLERLALEISKCEVRCCNCHRRKTIERGNWWLNGL